MTVRTRFAPSPTGYLHIGGVRTALFNWLYARQKGGQFILRIDDTDAQRNVAEALLPILDGFRWLGIDWDEGPTDDGKNSRGPHGSYFQSRRLERYQAAVEQLLAKGFAYRDFATPEELKAVPSMPASLDEALQCLEEDHDFLLKDDVFTEELLETWITYKQKNEADAVRLRPHPYEFALYYDI